MDVLYTLPGKVKVEWEPSVRAIIDHWLSPPSVTLAEFRTVTLEKGLEHALAHGGHARIVDNSEARGAFNQEIQAFIGTDMLPACVHAHLKYLLVVAAVDSPLANLSAKKYEAKVTATDIQLVQVASVDEAVTWLREHAR